jgi:N-acetylmuramoyl-L-alanine amidase
METRINIVISPSQQDRNYTAIGDKSADTESELTRLVGVEVVNLLARDNRLNVHLVPDFNLGDDRQNLQTAIDDSNKFIRQNGGKGYHLDLHTDGGYAGHGASAFYVSEAGKGFIAPIFNEMCKLTPWDDMTMTKRNNLAVLNQTIATAGLLEISFHDKVSEAYWVFNNVKAIATAIVNGIYLGIGLARFCVAKWQFDAYTELSESGFLDSPSYWNNRLHEGITVGEVMALINKVRKVGSK